MPSNKELIADAERLAKALGTAVVTDGLKNDALVKLVSDLDAQSVALTKAEADARERAAADAAEAERVAAEKAEADARERAADAARDAAASKREPLYTIAAKNSVTSRRGILAAGTVVTARDFAGGAKSLFELVASGTVVES